MLPRGGNSVQKSVGWKRLSNKAFCEVGLVGFQHSALSEINTNLQMRGF